MNTTCIPLAGPSHAPAHPIARAWHALAARWSAHLEDLRQAREADALAELNEDTLRDIGAPERWVARAVHRGEAQQRQLLELRQWRGG